MVVWEGGHCACRRQRRACTCGLDRQWGRRGRRGRCDGQRWGSVWRGAWGGASGGGGLGVGGGGEGGGGVVIGGVIGCTSGSAAGAARASAASRHAPPRVAGLLRASAGGGGRSGAVAGGGVRASIRFASSRGRPAALRRRGVPWRRRPALWGRAAGSAARAGLPLAAQLVVGHQGCCPWSIVLSQRSSSFCFRVARHLIFILRGGLHDFTSRTQKSDKREELWVARTREVRRGHAMPAPIRHHRALGEPVAIVRGSAEVDDCLPIVEKAVATPRRDRRQSM